MVAAVGFSAPGSVAHGFLRPSGPPTPRPPTAPRAGPVGSGGTLQVLPSNVKISEARQPAGQQARQQQAAGREAAGARDGQAPAAQARRFLAETVVRAPPDTVSSWLPDWLDVRLTSCPRATGKVPSLWHCLDCEAGDCGIHSAGQGSATVSGVPAGFPGPVCW